MKLYIDSLESEKEELKYKNHLKKLKIEQLTQKISNLKNNTVKIEEKGKELMNFMTRAEEIKMSRLQGSNIMRTMRRYSSSVNVGGLMRQKKPSIQVSNQ